MFDPSVFWGHNECKYLAKYQGPYIQIAYKFVFADDLDNMNIPRYRLGRNWMSEYHKHFKNFRS